jgi:PhnB protein
MTTKNTPPQGVQTYLFLEGFCEEAIQFYVRELGAKVQMMMRYKESPEPPQPGMCPPNSGDKIMHASLQIGETTLLMSDGRCSGRTHLLGFALSLAVSSTGEADRLFAALCNGGNIVMPLTKTFFSERFGMVTDKFGVMWMVIIPQHKIGAGA